MKLTSLLGTKFCWPFRKPDSLEWQEKGKSQFVPSCPFHRYLQTHFGLYLTITGLHDRWKIKISVHHGHSFFIPQLFLAFYWKLPNTFHYKGLRALPKFSHSSCNFFCWLDASGWFCLDLFWYFFLEIFQSFPRKNLGENVYIVAYVKN